MKYLKFLLGAFLSLALAGCGGSRASISEDWNWRPKTVAVIFSDARIANTDDLEDDWPEYVNSFHEWMSAELKQDIEAMARPLSDGSKLQVVTKYIAVGDSGIPTFYAFESDKVTIDGKDAFTISDERLALPAADVYLFIEDIDINSVLTGGGLGLLGLLLHEGIMTMKAFYSFYDGKTHERLGNGYLEAEEEYVFGVSKSNWKKLFRRSVKRVFNKTPVLRCDNCPVRSGTN
jgi:hypothetical protein